MDAYRTRLIDPFLDELMQAEPAVMLVGPRAVGKTTTAIRRATSVVRLDRAAEAGAFLADPDAALRTLAEPVLLDEWQEVPGVLGAVKRAIDEDPRPGRFVITGSVRGGLSGETWPGTGRVVRVSLDGMTIRERLDRTDGPAFFDRLIDGSALTVPADPPDLRGYVELALESGFPTAIDRSPLRREDWLASYVEQLVTRDAAAIGRLRDPSKLRRFLSSLAANSAGVVSDQTLLEASGIDRKTAQGYERLLEDLGIVASLPAWSSNRLQRLVHSPKRYVIDAAIVATVLRADVDTIMRDADLLGRIIDTFVLSQLRAERAVSDCRPTFHHMRDVQGRHEVDLVVEIRGQRVVACEIKANASPSASDARHLAWLRDKLDDRFVMGVVLHTGPSVFTLGDRVVAVPIAALWG